MAGRRLGAGSQRIEIIGIIKEFVACPAEPRLSGQVSQDLSRVPLLLRLCGRRQISLIMSISSNQQIKLEERR